MLIRMIQQKWPGKHVHSAPFRPRAAPSCALSRPCCTGHRLVSKATAVLYFVTVIISRLIKNEQTTTDRVAFWQWVRPLEVEDGSGNFFFHPDEYRNNTIDKEARCRCLETPYLPVTSFEVSNAAAHESRHHEYAMRISLLAEKK